MNAFAHLVFFIIAQILLVVNRYIKNSQINSLKQFVQLHYHSKSFHLTVFCQNQCQRLTFAKDCDTIYTIIG